MEIKLGQAEMIEMFDYFNDDNNCTEDFEKFYQSRELINNWNKLSEKELDRAKIQLETYGFTLI